MTKTFRGAFVAGLLCFAAPAAAVTVVPIAGVYDTGCNCVVYPGVVFTEKLPAGAPGVTTGVYGVEVRGGNNATNGTWEVGVGPGTSQNNFFNQGQKAWGAGTTTHNWSLTWTAAGISFAIDNGAPVTWGAGAGLLGNTLKIYAKRTTATVVALDGVTLNTAIPLNGETIFYSPDAFGGNGFTANGTLTMTGGGNSAYEVMFKHGVSAAVPEPATWTLLIGGFGLAGGALRRRRALTGSLAAS